MLLLLHLDRQASLSETNILARPHVMDYVLGALLRVESWYLVKLDSNTPLSVMRAQKKQMDAFS
jgi:hypothetical protein